jgi:hypothetical protein
MVLLVLEHNLNEQEETHVLTEYGIGDSRLDHASEAFRNPHSPTHGSVTPAGDSGDDPIHDKDSSISSSIRSQKYTQSTLVRQACTWACLAKS